MVVQSVSGWRDCAGPLNKVGDLFTLSKQAVKQAGRQAVKHTTISSAQGATYYESFMRCSLQQQASHAQGVFPGQRDRAEEQLLSNKQFGNANGNVQLIKEPNNLRNIHCYKHSGLANKKTMIWFFSSFVLCTRHPRARLVPF